MKHTTRSASLVALGAVTAVAMAACGAPGTADAGSKEETRASPPRRRSPAR